MTTTGEYVQSKNKPKEIRECIVQMNKFLGERHGQRGQNPAISSIRIKIEELKEGEVIASLYRDHIQSYIRHYVPHFQQG